MTQRPKRERSTHKSDDEAQPSLRFNVSTLLQEPIGNRRYYDVLDAPIDLEGDTTSVSGPVDMMRTDGSILVTATLALTVQEACSICLDSFGLPLELELREEFWPEVDPLSHLPLDVPDEREGFPVVEAHLDLSEAIRQYVLMARPISARCGADCPGPPVVAGVTFHFSADEAEPDSGTDCATPATSKIDTRWAALRRLRDEIGPDGPGGSEQEED
jgi:uncharacterized protein